MDSIELLKQRLTRLQNELETVKKHISNISDNPSNSSEIEYMKGRDLKYWNNEMSNINSEIHLTRRQIKAAVDQQKISDGFKVCKIDIGNAKLDNTLMNIDVMYNNVFTKVAQNIKTGSQVIQTIAWVNLFEPAWYIYKERQDKGLIQTEEDYADTIASRYVMYAHNNIFFKQKEVENFQQKFPDNVIKILDIGSMVDNKFKQHVELCEQNGTIWLSARVLIYVNKYGDVGSEILDDEWNKYNLDGEKI